MEIPYEVTPRRDTGLYNAKLGVWLFLASEVMLFGGLFASYVFLRVGVQDGVDNPWPMGLSVHEGFVWLGFINTLVLIASSVGVVLAWVALKERNWRRYQIYMYSVIACAAVFMGIKAVEYTSKFNKHGIKLTDNSVIEGKVLDGSDRIRFEGEEISFSLRGNLPLFLKDVEGEFPVLTLQSPLKEGEEPVEIRSASELRSWFGRARRQVSGQVAAERRRFRAEIKAEVDNPRRPEVSTSAVLRAAEPFEMRVNPRVVVSHSDSAVSYRDGTRVEGRLVGDDVTFVVKKVDMQLVLPQRQRESVAWEVIDDESAKRDFFAKQAQKYQKMLDYYERRDRVVPERVLRGSMLNFHKVNFENGSVGDGNGDDYGAAATVTVPRDQIKFLGNHGPRYSNYHATYFTMTALHGLHVVGGALVLLFFTVFGKRLYLKNPEHLANRVEVGGLFWHFVDLIWIFLFPVMYLF